MTPSAHCVSVVMPVFNGAATVEAAIRSVLSQTHSDLELIVIDDGSTDETPDILAGLAGDSRVRCIRQENAGVTPATDQGCRISQSPFLARHDADDLSAPHRLERQVAFLKDHPDHVLVCSDCEVIDESGAKQGYIRNPPDDRRIRALLRRHNCLQHGAVMMRRDALERAGEYRTAFRYASDYDLWLRLIEEGKAASIQEPLYKWRTSESQISSRHKRQQALYSCVAGAFATERRRKGKDSYDALSKAESLEEFVAGYDFAYEVWLRYGVRWLRQLDIPEAKSGFRRATRCSGVFTRAAALLAASHMGRPVLSLIRQVKRRFNRYGVRT